MYNQIFCTINYTTQTSIYSKYVPYPTSETYPSMCANDQIIRMQQDINLSSKPIFDPKTQLIFTYIRCLKPNTIFELIKCLVMDSPKVFKRKLSRFLNCTYVHAHVYTHAHTQNP